MTVKIDFQVETKLGTYSDALHLEDDHGLTDEQIEDMKQQRANNWVAHVESASAAETPPVEEPPVLPEGVLPHEIVQPE